MEQTTPKRKDKTMLTLITIAATIALATGLFCLIAGTACAITVTLLD